MATFELQFSKSLESIGDTGGAGLGSDLLADNARWFIRVRWIVILVFTITGLAFLFFGERLATIGVSLSSTSLFVLAGILVAANVVFRFLSSGFRPDTPVRRVKINIWSQIILDLAAVTAIVYLTGSTDSFVPFAYLFHIALACIFLPPKQSLLVLVSAVVLYSALVCLEYGGVIPELGMYQEAAGRATTAGSFRRLVQSVTWVIVCFVVWYLIATLSNAVRRRDRQLELMNRQLMDVHEEMNRQMLVITHDLKAPFSGIESNIEVLRVRFWDDLPDKVQTIIDRINSRSEVLRQRIDSILMLGELRSQSIDKDTEVVEFDVVEVIQSVIENLRDRARERDVTIDLELDSCLVTTDRQKLLVLFENLISNAISYSQEGGSVEVDGVRSGSTIDIRVVDHGIGIREDALPHIFEEYFRSREAARFNRSSTGLGLAIVKEIASHLDLRISVESAEGTGTTFRASIPIAGPGNLKE